MMVDIDPMLSNDFLNSKIVAMDSVYIISILIKLDKFGRATQEIIPKMAKSAVPSSSRLL